MNESQVYFSMNLSTPYGVVSVKRAFDNEDVTWKDLLEQFEKLIKGAGYVAPKLNSFIRSIDFDVPEEEEQATQRPA